MAKSYRFELKLTKYQYAKLKNDAQEEGYNTLSSYVRDKLQINEYENFY